MKISASIEPWAAAFWRQRAATARVLSAVLAVVSGAGCSAQPAVAKTAPPASVAPTSPSLEPSLQDRDWGVVRSKRQGLKLALPEGRAWLEPTPSNREGASWELRHEPTGSTVTVKRWRASRLPKIEACRRELGETSADLASADDTNLVSSRELRVPAGFVSRIELLALAGGARRLRGQALAVSAGVGECIAVIARTECTNEAELAERLRLFDVALSHLRLIRIDDRVPDRAPVPQ